MTTVYLGLGSSMGNKEEIIHSALEEIKTWGKNFRVSQHIESEPWGGIAQNTFLNLACSFQRDENSEMTPETLLKKIHETEKKYNRTRNIKWEDRTLDIDILLYGNETIKTKNLTIPHPYIAERDFVYKPLLEILDKNHFYYKFLTIQENIEI